MRKYALMLLVAFSGAAYGEGPVIVESWFCSPGTYYSATNVVVRAMVFDGRKFGDIDVAGGSQMAEFEIEGFNRRWNFGPVNKNGIYRYTFIVRPDGNGIYYDFKSTGADASPSQFFGCKQTT